MQEQIKQFKPQGCRSGAPSLKIECLAYSEAPQDKRPCGSSVVPSIRSALNSLPMDSRIPNRALYVDNWVSMQLHMDHSRFQAHHVFVERLFNLLMESVRFALVSNVSTRGTGIAILMGLQ